MTTIQEAFDSLRRQVAERVAEDALTPCTLSLDRAQAVLAALAEQHEPKREWVGLTDEERELIYHTNEPYADLEAVEALLKEKNT